MMLFQQNTLFKLPLYWGGGRFTHNEHFTLFCILISGPILFDYSLLSNFYPEKKD